ncbi:polymer-forming cytoskeletal protein [Paenibacillus timonensis]|uniref:Polymer-forming cytoskeletal protein n=1 Tax=Paenibacillus timonensis TaxID=225915 RepID=A0ABW3S876_9BACL|nr:polymer-forming cytoskeletal protein [Paenibacillus timonensis]MCH1638720.1 polymer-forming cytoskeletal protein [Paenibacillus timonensis]
MFKDNKKAPRLTDTLIGQGSLIEGKLECKSNLRLEGQIHGEIDCQGQVIIGETGEAMSNIKGAEVIVAGKVVGDVSTAGKLTITASGQVDGNVDVAKLIIVEGGLLNGSSKMERIAPAPTPSASSGKGKMKKAARPEAG